jgi:M6 family metalloprotease-like protein
LGALLALFLFSGSQAQEEFEESPWEGEPTVDPIDTTRGVALYACASYDTDHSLPTDYDNIWDTLRAYSIPSYFRDVSFGKHRVFGVPETWGDSCFVSDPYPGAAVGAQGAALRTGDLGNWVSSPSGTTKHLRGFCLPRPSFGVAVGDSGTILDTKDGGRTWHAQESGTLKCLGGAASHPNAFGTRIAVGDSGLVLRTTNSGATWYTIQRVTSRDLHGVAFFCYSSIGRGLAVGDSATVLRTLNGGGSWENRPQTLTRHLHGVAFANSNVAVAVGDSGTILRTEDFGDTFEVQPVPGLTQNLYAVTFVATSGIGYAVGDLGVILRTDDGGESWDPESSGVSVVLRGVCFSDSNHGAVVGDSGVILATGDGGATWEKRSSGLTTDLYATSSNRIFLEKDRGGGDFTWNILVKADSLVDFSRYDSTYDNIVDMVFLFVMRFSGWSSASLTMPVPTFVTNDTSASGDTIIIYSGNGIASLIVSGPKLLTVPIHEYGHKLGLDDYYNFTQPESSWGLGNFEVMSRSVGFGNLPSPPNPWFRSGYGSRPLQWLGLTRVNQSVADQPIRDVTYGETYELASDFQGEPLMAGQRFLVSNHQRKSHWEEDWPDVGLMVWHVYENSNGTTSGDTRKKRVDIEASHGLWDWDSVSHTPTSPNPISGLDSLDVKRSMPGDDGYVGSATCMYRAGVDSTFDAFTNPSSDEYHIGGPIPLQDIASHVAVRDIHADSADPYIVRADLFVNRVESDEGTATAENNGRRWLLDPDGVTMHLVYASKGYIYYATTDSSKVWLPAIPIGVGAYPAMGMDASGNPAVVWLRQLGCNEGQDVCHFLLFSRKQDNGAWTEPVELLSSDSCCLGAPSFAVDTLDTGHVVYRTGPCGVFGEYGICYGSFSLNSPSLQVQSLGESDTSCGNPSISYTDGSDCIQSGLESIHAVWEKEGAIWYNWRDSTGWHDSEEVSAGSLVPCKTPSLDVRHGPLVHVVWVTEETGVPMPREAIYYRSRTVGDSGSWGDTSCVSGWDLYMARHPVVVYGPAGPCVVWSEFPTDGSNFDIYCAKWVDDEWERQGNLSGTPAQSSYPQAIQRFQPSGSSSVVLDVVYTDGNAAPYHVANEGPSIGTGFRGGGQGAMVDRPSPKIFMLGSPFPSPFAEEAVIRYQVPRSAAVSITVYDVAGRFVREIASGQHKPGSYSVIWPGEDSSGKSVSSGVYFVRMESSEFSATRKAILLR